MKTLTSQLERYLTVRRNLGYDLSFAERVLRRFTNFADTEGADHITVDLFLRWKDHFGSANNNTWSNRLSMVRVFATWLQSVDPRTEVLPKGLVRGKLARARPFIYTNDQVAEIVTTAGRLSSDYGLRGWTCSTMFGLIAATGLRVSESIGLDDMDVDLDEDVLTVRRGKNGRSRYVPFAKSVADQLHAYRRERKRLLGGHTEAFFLLDTGRRPTDCAVRYNFALVCQRLGLREPQVFYKHGRGPRIHDLRHTFAVRTIIDWYRNGLDTDREMIKLSTYLGHARPENTYWYIEAVPELMQLASERATNSLVAGDLQ